MLKARGLFFIIPRLRFERELYNQTKSFKILNMTTGFNFETLLILSTIEMTFCNTYGSLYRQTAIIPPPKESVPRRTLLQF